MRPETLTNFRVRPLPNESSTPPDAFRPADTYTDDELMFESEVSRTLYEPCGGGRRIVRKRLGE